MDEFKKNWIVLSSALGMSPRYFYLLLNKFSDLGEIFDDAACIREKIPSFPQKLIYGIKKCSDKKYAEMLFENIHSCGLNITTACDNDYPYLLKDQQYTQPTLYYKGQLPEDWERSVTVVGTRHPTKDGEKSITQIAKELAANGVAVVSGMARGLDSAAHRGALGSNGKTYAVLGCGADIVYPRENKRLYDEITENGAVISHFPPGTPPIAENFPVRNNILAAITNAVVAGEGKIKSGVSITVDIAADIGRNIFAVPGDICKETSVLPNTLIQNGAKLIQSGLDIMYEMGWEIKKNHSEKKAASDFELDFLQQQIYNLLLKGNYNVDSMAEELSASVSDINSALTIMEILNIIECIPGNIYCLK